ncbi:hypothetical protein HBI64_042700 [Parastagonospora nodorum]|nr:hypothetical protein HBI20_169300 [Parastagonospora nodorum]KAH6136205.1 hypothetical protein HBI64_042700 [Parastagonospora nodorum]
MHVSSTFPALLSFGLLASGLVVRDIAEDVDAETLNPKTIPQTIRRLGRGENKFKKQWKTAPASCTDLVHPSEQCIKDMQAQPHTNDVIAFSGGELKLDNNHKCSDTQFGQFQTAAWDALQLGSYMGAPDPKNYKDAVTWRTWMGPNYPDYSKRIVDNFNRVVDFEGRKKFDIYVTCSDPKNYCNIQKDGKNIGGYAYAVKGWFGYMYYYIAACAPFFTMDDLDTKINQIEKDLRNGNLNSATRAVWQKNIGQVFLHEMMHLDVVGQPHINDEHVDPDSAQNWAYGPNRTHMLARRALNQGGGAARASTNADSYAWLANSKLFYDITNYFPAPDNYKDKTRSSPADTPNMELDAWMLDFGAITEKTTDAELEERKNKILASMGGASEENKPLPKGKSLSIAMATQVNSHSGGASLDARWHFYNTPLNRAVACDDKSPEVKELTPQGPSDPKSNFGGNHKELVWPGGSFKLDIEGAQCEYKSDGTNAGNLYCPGRVVGCKEDRLKATDQGLPQCGSSRVKFHPAVFCDF